MMKKASAILTSVLFTVIIFGLCLAHILLPDGELSSTERRKLAQFPEFSVSTLMDGVFMQNIEKYLPDQFPLRETFRTIKAVFEKYSGRLDASDIYTVDGSMAALDDPNNENQIISAAKKFNAMRELIGGKNSYLCVVPPKTYYMQDGVHPTADFEAMLSLLYENAEGFTTIDIRDTLDLSSYYLTDSHWRQELLEETVLHLVKEMGLEKPVFPEYTVKEIPSFYGVYAGQSALPVKPETIYYLTNDSLDNAMVTAVGADVTSVYTLNRLENENSLDKYDLFLGGAVAVVEIVNENAVTDRELVVMRDSFGSSIIPLLSEYYSKITAIDMRYLSSMYVKNFVDTENVDFLVLLSPGVINQSAMLKVN